MSSSIRHVTAGRSGSLSSTLRAGTTALLFAVFIPAGAGFGPGLTAEVHASVCQRSPMTVTSRYVVGPRNMSQKRSRKRGERRAKRKWSRRAERLYGCQYGQLSAATNVHMRCGGNSCTLTATPCRATGLICN